MDTTTKAPFIHHVYLDLNKKDSLGQYPDKKQVGKSYFHPKTRRIYRVSGFVWNSTTDTWNIEYNRDGCSIRFTRELKEFNDGRFVEIENAGPEDD